MSEAKVTPITKKQATRGKVVHLHKYWKGIAEMLPTKESRRQFLNLMLDATQTEHEEKNKRRKSKDQKDNDND